MTVNYRCTLRAKCGASKTLSKPIEMYDQRPMCPGCNGDTLKSVNDREKARNTRRKCLCDGYPYPHHEGTEPWCKHAKFGPTNDDYKERYG